MRQLRKPGLKRPKRLPVYPPNHQLGMKVPLGGSDCLKCEYLGMDSKTCKKEEFINWNNHDNRLPAPANSYCCDFFAIGDKYK